MEASEKGGTRSVSLMKVCGNFVSSGVLSGFLASRDQRRRTSNALGPLRYFWILKGLALVAFVREVDPR